MRSERGFLTGERGLTLQVHEWGPASGRPTLILHGYLEQGFAWDRVAREILARSPDRRIVAPDHRGHGASGHLGDGGFYHFPDYIADVDALVRDLGAPIDLIGHSMGGTIAGYFAGCRPEAVRRLILVEGLGPPDDTALTVAKARKHLDDRVKIPRHGVLTDEGEAAGRLRRVNPELRPELALELAARLVEPADEGVRWRWDAFHRARNFFPFDEQRFTLFLAEITAPTLLISGAKTPYQFADLARRAAAIGHHEELVIEGAGHMVHHDAPVALAEAVVGFLDR